MIDAAMNGSRMTDTVRFSDGSQGLLLTAPPQADAKLPPGLDVMAEVLLDSGQRLFLPLDALIPHDEGGHRVATHPSGFGGPVTEDVAVIPLIAETLTVGKREVETGKVRFRTAVTERVETVDEPLVRTEVSMRRVEVGQFVDSPPSIRYEGNAMIIPILEEVLVVEKRLRLKEEVYVTQVQTQYRDPQSVTLRHETLIEERLPAENNLPAENIVQS